MEKHIWTVHNVNKIVDVNGKVHLPQDFLNFLNIRKRETVTLALYEGDQTIRIRKDVSSYDRVHTKKKIDVSGKIHIPKSYGGRLSIGAGNSVIVSLCEGPLPEIRIKKKRR